MNAWDPYTVRIVGRHDLHSRWATPDAAERAAGDANARAKALGLSTRYVTAYEPLHNGGRPLTLGRRAVPHDR